MSDSKIKLSILTSIFNIFIESNKHWSQQNFTQNREKKYLKIWRYNISVGTIYKTLKDNCFPMESFFNNAQKVQNNKN